MKRQGEVTAIATVVMVVVMVIIGTVTVEMAARVEAVVMVRLGEEKEGECVTMTEGGEECVVVIAEAM